MTQHRPPVGLPTRLVLITLAAAAMAGTVLTLPALLPRRAADAAAGPAVAVAAPRAPIAAEADLFRAGIAMPTDDGAVQRRRAAHPRTLASYRRLRAYPGAPPRIPHGLTTDEFRTTGCGACHERGGYSQRFGTYAPVTPHPERADCLQCHTADADLVGTPLPAAGGDAVCLQCHVPGRTPIAGVPLDWQPAEWPALAPVDGMPPPIPHDLAMRTRCLACHDGAAAVAGIRTTHPERTSCRQCHLAVGDDAAIFQRPPRAPAAAPGGTP
jgi:nitrate reductase (cytochrome), electron transfer subunit